MIREVIQSTDIPSGPCVLWSVSRTESLSICSSELFQTMGGETEADPGSLCCVLLELGVEGATEARENWILSCGSGKAHGEGALQLGQ